MILLYILFPVITFAVKYAIEPHHENIYSPCSEYPDVHPEKVLDLSNFKVVTISNGSCHVFGDVVWNVDVEEDIIPVKIETYKKVRGSWVNTIYNIHRSDTCSSLFRPSEMWAKFVKDVPEEQRKCPLKKGNQFTSDIVPDLTFDFPDRNLEGDYKLNVLMTYKTSGKAALCFNIEFALYRT